MKDGIIPASWADHALAALRIITGLLFLAHGTAKIFQWPLVDMFKDGVPFVSLMGIGGLLEAGAALTQLSDRPTPLVGVWLPALAVQAERPWAPCCKIQEDEALEDRQFAAVKDRIEASGSVEHEIGYGHHARQNESSCACE